MKEIASEKKMRNNVFKDSNMSSHKRLSKSRNKSPKETAHKKFHKKIMLNFEYNQEGDTHEHTFRKNGSESPKAGRDKRESQKRGELRPEKKKPKKKKSKRGFKEIKNYDLLSKTVEIKAGKVMSNNRKLKKQHSFFPGNLDTVGKRRSSDAGLEIKKQKRKSIFNKERGRLDLKKKKKANVDEQLIVRSKSFLGAIKATGKKPNVSTKQRPKKKKIPKAARGTSQSEKVIKKEAIGRSKKTGESQEARRNKLNDSCMDKLQVKVKLQSGKGSKVDNRELLKLSLGGAEKQASRKGIFAREETPLRRGTRQDERKEAKKKSEKSAFLKPPPVKLNKSSKKGNLHRKKIDNFRSPKDRRRKGNKASNSQSRYIIDILKDKKTVPKKPITPTKNSKRNKKKIISKKKMKSGEEWVPVPFAMAKSASDHIRWNLRGSVSARGGVHLGGVCYMPDEEVFLVGGWNNRILAIHDAHPERYLQEIMEIQVQNLENIAFLKYIDELKFLLVGSFKSNLSVYR